MKRQVIRHAIQVERQDIGQVMQVERQVIRQVVPMERSGTAVYLGLILQIGPGS